MMGSAGSFTVGLLMMALPVVGATSILGPTGDPSPHASNAIDASYETRVLESLEGFEVGVDLKIHEIDVAGAGGRTALELRAAPEPLRAVFEDYAQAAIRDEASSLLSEADVRISDFTVDYGLEDGDANPYVPPVVIRATVHAAFTPGFFGLPPTTQTPGHELARAFLYSGGTYRVARNVEVPPGYDVAHVLRVPAGLELREPREAARQELEYRLDNLAGREAHPLALDFALGLGEVPANVRSGPLVRALFVIDDETPFWKQSLPFLGGEYRGQLDLDIHVHSLDASLFGAYPLPRQVELRAISADLLRIAIREGLIVRGDVETFFEDLIRRSLEEGFGPDIALELDWAALTSSLNEAVGGTDGRSVRPLMIRAHAVLPFTSNKMLVSSSLGRLVAMTVGTSGAFDLANDGIWNAEYRVAYPHGVQVDVRDSAGLTENTDWGGRDGFTIDLPRGASTRVQVEGRAQFEAHVFAVGLAEIGLVGVLAFLGIRRLRTYLRGKTAPLAA